MSSNTHTQSLKPQQQFFYEALHWTDCRSNI